VEIELNSLPSANNEPLIGLTAVANNEPLIGLTAVLKRRESFPLRTLSVSNISQLRWEMDEK